MMQVSLLLDQEGPSDKKLEGPGGTPCPLQCIASLAAAQENWNLPLEAALKGLRPRRGRSPFCHGT